MNKSFYALAASAMLCMSAAQAAQADDPSVQISSPKSHFKMYPSDFESYAGSYALENGDVIKLKRAGSHYYSKIYGQDPVEIFAVGRGSFIAKDGTTLTFQDNNETIVITEGNQRRLASR
ncbi:MAG TPA: hypothetical protein VGP06_14140 [Janthinobacterium sp.]|jgi:opacity protein-like surface antigen|nr:hypothetical protein [Janthinobacterium sp.]